MCNWIAPDLGQLDCCMKRKDAEKKDNNDEEYSLSSWLEVKDGHLHYSDESLRSGMNVAPPRIRTSRWQFLRHN